MQKLDGEEKVLALEFSAFQPLCDALASMVGSWVFIFWLEAHLQGRQKVTCQMDYEAFVVKLPPNGTRDALTSELSQSNAANSVLLTSKWTAQEATFKVDGEQPLVCASLLRVVGLSETLASVHPRTWQMCFCFVDVPTASIMTQDGARIWFGSVLRDFSGDVDVFVTEKAALGLAGVHSRQELEESFNAGSLQLFPSNVRGGIQVRDAKVECLIIEAQRFQIQKPLTQKASSILSPMKVVGRTSGAVLPSALAELLPDAFAGLMVKDVPVRKALVFVKGLERTTMMKLGEQRKMTTAVKLSLIHI